MMPQLAPTAIAPDEMYFEAGAGGREELAEAWKRAREARLAANRAMSCAPCRSEREVAHETRTPVIIPRVLQLHPSDSRRSAWIARAFKKKAEVQSAHARVREHRAQ